MFIRGNHVPVENFLNVVHMKMINRYTSNGVIGQAEAMEANAKKLQTFFYSLKNNINNTDTDDVTWNMVSNQIIDDVAVLTGSRAKLFKTKGGLNFEKQLSNVVYSILNQVSDGDLQKNYQSGLKKIHVGSKTSNIDLEKNILDPTVQTALTSVGTKTEKYFNTQHGKEKMYYLTNVQGKVDVRGYSVKVVGSPNSYLLEIYDLLKDATFSAKNYTAFYWNNNLKVYQWGGSLRLGATNFFRCFYGVLSDLGYNHPIIMSAFWSSYYGWERQPQVALRLNQIRFVYELTGAGLLKGGNVKYLIYNNPQTNEIYVQSTAKIIKDHLTSDLVGYNNPFIGTSAIDKSFFT